VASQCCPPGGSVSLHSLTSGIRPLWGLGVPKRPSRYLGSNGAGVPIPPSWRRWDGGWCSQLTVTPHSETTTNSYDRRRSDSSSRRSFGRSVSGRARAHRPSDSHGDSPLLGARCVPT
jgi:hypothetical protein